MLLEIKKKRLILENRKPFDPDIAVYYDEVNRADWIYTNLKLEGSALQKTDIENVLRGEFLIHVALGDHAAINALSETLKELFALARMQISLDEKTLFRIWSCLFPNETQEVRRSNPILRALAYNPPHFKEIEEQLALLFQWLPSINEEPDPIAIAATLHHKIVEIYPFEVGSEAVARAAAQYVLICAGFPPIAWNFSETEYYEAIRLYLKKEEIGPMYEMLLRGIYNKLEVLVRLTEEA